jgi:zinc transport system substrate-binding protein
MQKDIGVIDKGESMKRCYSVFLGFLLLLPAPLLWGSEALTVYTVNYPLQYFTQRIAGEHARVMFPAPADVDPAFWMPDRETVSDYQRADLIVLNGAAYARWVTKVSLPGRKQVDTSKAFEHGLITVEDSVTHSHGPSGEHSHAGRAFTTWLDFHQAVQQAEAIAEALSSKLPEHQPEFEKNLAALRTDLMRLDLELQQTVAGKPRQLLFASHPVYHYLARRYELHIQDMVWEPDDMPSDQQWLQLRLAQERFPAVWMLWEKQPIAEIAQQLDSTGISVAVFDPCANRPASGDFLSVMQDNIANLKRAFADAGNDL